MGEKGGDGSQFGNQLYFELLSVLFRRPLSVYLTVESSGQTIDAVSWQVGRLKKLENKRF